MRHKLLLVAVSLAVISAMYSQTTYLNNRQYDLIDGQWFQIENGQQYLVNNLVITVKFQEGVYQSQITGLNAAQGIQVLRVNILGFYDLQVPGGSDPLTVVQNYLNSGLVEIAEPNTFGEYIGDPNDTLFPNQWHHKNANDHDIDTPEAWEWEVGDPGIIIGILDSGTDYDHEDLVDNIWVNPGEDLDNDGVVWDDDDMNGIDDGNGLIDDLVGWDFYNGNKDVKGPYYHGTHVAGVSGAYTDNLKGVAGVSGGWGQTTRGSNLLICNVGDWAPDGSILDDAILYAASKNVKVITMSLSVGESDAINYALGAAYLTYGAFVDCAAGNNYCGSVTYPANNQYVVAVGASDQDDCQAYYSACGSFVVAPGSGIWSTQKNNTYGSSSGTSFAAPMVAGVAALLFSYDASYTNTFVEEIIARSADKVHSEDPQDPDCYYPYNQTLQYGAWDDKVGYGRLNAYRAVAPPEAPVLSISGSWGDNPTLSWVDKGEPDIDHSVLKKRYTNESGTMTTYVDPAPNPYTDLGIVIQKRGRTKAEYWVKSVDITNQSSPYSNKKTTYGLGPYWKEVVHENVLPKNYGLAENYPNPFNPVTTIGYGLPEDSFVELRIYDLLGREIRTLVNGNEATGFKSTIWDGKDYYGDPVSSGMYLYQFSARSLDTDKQFSKTRKMVLLR